MFITLLQLAGCLPLLLGLFVLFHILRPQRPPADESNRINKIRLLWWCLTREQMFVDKLPWLRYDETDNIYPYK